MTNLLGPPPPRVGPTRRATVLVLAGFSSSLCSLVSTPDLTRAVVTCIPENCNPKPSPAREAQNSSCGFEHVFLGEVDQKSGEVSGLHNWVQFWIEEKKGNLDYRGYILPRSRGEVRWNGYAGGGGGRKWGGGWWRGECIDAGVHVRVHVHFCLLWKGGEGPFLKFATLPM